MDEGFLLFIVTTRLRNIKLLVSFMPKQGFESRPADILGHTCLTSAQQLQIPELSVSHLKMKMDLMAVRSVYAHFTLSLTVFPLKKKNHPLYHQAVSPTTFFSIKETGFPE